MKHQFSTAPLHRQQGRTILGFCLGLMVGLLLALGISIFINKVPMKISGDPNSRTMTLEEELQRNRSWDPNAPLRSRTPNLNGEQPATGNTQSNTNNSNTTSGDTSTTNTTTANTNSGSTSTTQNNDNASSDPLGDLARAASSNANAPVVNNTINNPSSANGSNIIYFVQVGAFGSGANAEARRAELSLAGINAKVTEREQAGRPSFRVRVGPFNNRASADAALAQAQSRGFDAQMVRAAR